MRHDEPSDRVELPEEVRDAIKKFENSEYIKNLRATLAPLKGKVVTFTQAGSSGFILHFEGGTWAAAYLDSERLVAETGAGIPPLAVMKRLSSDSFGDASAPLTVNLPYANQSCDIASEIASAVAQPITGFAFGANCFNFCFPGGMELDTMVVPDAQGRTALRVYWEQW